MVGDLSNFADQLRKEGFDARNLGQVGITIWEGSDGFFIPADELKQLPRDVQLRDFRQILEQRRANGNH